MQVQDRSPTVSDAVLALKRVLGDRAYNERRGFYSFYVDQILDMYGQQGMMEATSASAPAAAAAAATIPTGGPDIMRNWGSSENINPNQEIVPLDSEEEEALRSHIDRWQSKTKNLPDPFAPARTWTRADGTALPAAGTGTSGAAAPEDLPPPSVILPAGQVNSEYAKKVGSGASGAAAADSVNALRPPAGTQWQYKINPDYLDRQAAKQQANSVPAGNAVSTTGKTEPVRMSMTLGNGAGDSGEITTGSKGRIDQATIDRARAWAAKQNAPAAGGTTASKTTAPLWQALAQANGIANPNLIYPGQLIKLPNGTFAEVNKGDTLSGIANRYRQGYYNDGDGTSSGLPANRRDDLTAIRPRKPVKESIDINRMQNLAGIRKK